MLGLTIWDFVFAPFVILLVSFIAKAIKKRYAHSAELVFYFTWGFRIKMLMIIVYSILSGSVIAGDQIVLYFGEGKHFAELIKENISNIDLLFTNGGPVIDQIADEKGYLMMESNYLVVKISIILCLFTTSKFMLINIILGFIAFLGSWQLFMFFRNLYPQLHKGLAFATMGIPTVVFWSSGINKETICMACLGFLTKCLFDIVVYKKRILLYSFICFLAIFIIGTIKSYIIISYLPFFLFFLLLYKINKTNNFFFRIILKLTIPVMFMLSVAYIYFNGEELFTRFSSEKVLDSITYNQKAFQNQASYESGSFFTAGDFDGSFAGLLKMAPIAITTTFFRPYIWECRNLIMLLSSIEGMTLLLFTLSLFFIRKGIRTFFHTLVSDPVVLYSIAFSLLFAIFIGASTFNFGSLVRYKIPCIPFFVSALIIIKSYIVSAKNSDTIVN